MIIRLDKYLADIGIGTRSEVKADIKKGKININGIVVKDANLKIDTDKDKVLYQGNPIVYEEFEYYMLNKPAGVVSATTDKNDKTVVDLITSKKKKDLFPVCLADITPLAHSLNAFSRHHLWQTATHLTTRVKQTRTDFILEKTSSARTSLLIFSAVRMTKQIPTSSFLEIQVKASLIS